MKTLMVWFGVFLGCVSLAGFDNRASAQATLPTDVAIEGHVYKPKQLPVTPARVAGLKLPQGFQISIYAEGLEKPRMLAAAPDGAVYVTRRDPGDLWLLRDADKDGKAELKKKLAEKNDLHGIALSGQEMFLVSSEQVFGATRTADGGIGPLRTLAKDLPAGGQHNNRTIGVGPDSKLYVSIGSTCNSCEETTDESATLIQLERDGRGRRIFATGLRNTIGFAWHPRTGALWGMDHGIDWLGDDDQREELNRIEDGKQYGWPYTYADGKANPANQPPNGLTPAQWAARSTNPVLTHTAHSAPMQLAFYTGSQFPASYRNGAFLALHGSWNRKPASGYELVFVRFDDAGQPTAIESFLSGFQTPASGSEPATFFGRPCGVAVAPDGSLLLSDDANGVIYRVQYGKAQAAKR